MRFSLLFLALILAGCPQYTGPQADATYFWQIKTSTLEFGACSDAVSFCRRRSVIPNSLVSTSNE